MASQPDPFLPFVEVPSTRAKERFPLTEFICDLIRDGKPKARENWKAGKYGSINPAHAAWYAESVR